MKNIVIIGGGTGTFTLLASLRSYPCNTSVIVSTADNGGSTGALREELGVMPMGDIRNCLSGLATVDSPFSRAFSYRFESGSLKGHVLGNIVLAALQKVTGTVEGAIIQCAKLLDVSGHVVPVTLEPTELSAGLADGTVIVGEHAIDEPTHDGKRVIRSLALSPADPNPRALRLLADADLIVFGPGDLYTSTLPNLLVRGVADAVRSSRAKKVLITNLMTKYGQTDGFSASSFLTALERYLGEGMISTVVVNVQRPSDEWIVRYGGAHAEFVKPDIGEIEKKGRTVVADALVSENIFAKSCADQLTRSYLRHDSDKTAKHIWELIQTTSPALAN